MREAEARDFLAKCGIFAAIIGLLSLAMGLLWNQLGFGQLEFPEEQDERLAAVTQAYHREAHGRELPKDPTERAEFIAKVEPLKAAYDREVAAIDGASRWQEWKRQILIYGGAFLAVCGAFVAKTMDGGK